MSVEVIKVRFINNPDCHSVEFRPKTGLIMQCTVDGDILHVFDRVPGTLAQDKLSRALFHLRNVYVEIQHTQRETS